MKKKFVKGMMTALCAAALVTVTPALAPSVSADAATIQLAGGTSVDAVPVAGTVASGTTGTLLLLDTQIGQFRIVLDTNTQYGTTQYLNTGAIIQCDIYAGSDAQFHAADISINTNNTKAAGSIEVGTAIARAAGTTSTATTTTNTSASTSTAAKQQTTRVNGGVDSSTTNNLLVLNTSSGQMKITLDEDTDMSDGKVLIPNYTYYVDIYRGTGTYNHAAKVIDTSPNTVGSNKGVDTANTVTVSGTVVKGTVTNRLYLKTAGGQMTIKIDSGTDTSKCHVLKTDQPVTVTVAGATDGYLHAVSIVDDTKSKDPSYNEGAMGDAGMLTGQNTVTVRGSVNADSTDDILKLSVDGQTMLIRLDSGSKGTNVSAITPSQSYSVSLYLGTDGYNHVATITNLAGHDAGSGKNVNANAKTTVTGTITEARNDRIRLKDSTGSTWTIKIDMTTDVSKCRILRKDRKIKVTCGLGSDGYWHAVSLERTSD